MKTLKEITSSLGYIARKNTKDFYLDKIKKDILKYSLEGHSSITYSTLDFDIDFYFFFKNLREKEGLCCYENITEKTFTISW